MSKLVEGSDQWNKLEAKLNHVFMKSILEDVVTDQVTYGTTDKKEIRQLIKQGLVVDRYGSK